eukprot:CFRG2782T1
MSDNSDLEGFDEASPELKFKRTQSLTGESKLKAKEVPATDLLRKDTDDDDSISADFHAQACKWLKGHIRAWQGLDDTNIEVKVLRGGLTNLLFTCKAQGPDAHTIEPRKVLLRIYGDGTDLFFSRVLGEICFVLLSECRFGPKLYGVWTEGRLEEWLDMKTLAPEEMQYPDVSKSIAQNVASLHVMDMPFDKTPVILFNCKQWLAKAEFVAKSYIADIEKLPQLIELDEKDIKALTKHNFNERQQGWLAELFDYGVRDEYNWLLDEILKNVNTPIVFAHNDLQAGNIMCDENDNVKLIDFEYGNYNFLCYDIANHFAEWIFDYQNVPEWPYYSLTMEQWPDIETQRRFLVEYLTVRHRLTGRENISPSLSKIKRYLRDVNRLVLASHFQWVMWSVIQASMSKIDFPYLEFGLRRFEVYQRQKENLASVMKEIDQMK